jgi:hypothetical protein
MHIKIIRRVGDYIVLGVLRNEVTNKEDIYIFKDILK